MSHSVSPGAIKNANDAMRNTNSVSSKCMDSLARPEALRVRA